MFWLPSLLYFLRLSRWRRDGLPSPATQSFMAGLKNCRPVAMLTLSYRSRSKIPQHNFWSIPRDPRFN
eukprot:scaffold176937_cov38-Prasinocladus_malaysianus.AAC.2